MNAIPLRSLANLGRSAILVALALTSLACGGGGGGGGGNSNPPPVVNADLGGVWLGSITNTTVNETREAGGLSIASGEMRFLDEEGVTYRGQLTVTGNSFTGTVTAFAPPFFTFLDGSTVVSGTLSGQVTERTRISGTFTLASGETGSYVFDYLDVYERDSALSHLTGTWEDFFGDVYSVDSQGRIFGQDSGGCVYNGTVSLIDTRYNAYRVSLTVSNCGASNGTYTGLATLDDYESVGDMRGLVLLLTNGNVYGTANVFIKM